MDTLYYILIGAVSAAVGLSIEKALPKKMKPAARFILALVITLVIVCAVALLIKWIGK